MKITDTLSGKKETFTPGGNEVKMYVCGVTPYADAHIGHAMSYIIFDVIRRYLRFRGYQVKYVQNVTDIDDKIIDRAGRLGITPEALATKFTASYFEDMSALNIEPADIYPRATGEITKMLEVIKGLVEKGYAYSAQGSVYFRVRKVSDYGKLSRRNLDDMRSGDRIEAGEDKLDPLDFVLWKAAKPGEPSWESPWGKGRPGWHIECSAMSLKYLGESIDIHGGGQDLVFPHHENEIAQSESFTGVKPFARYWLHNGLLQLGEDKMSKSTGNLLTIKEILAKHTADALRLFVLGSHYRSPLTFTEEGLEAAQTGVDRLQRAISRYEASGTGKPLNAESYRQKFVDAMDDDFNTSQTLAVLFDLARDINQASDAGLIVNNAQDTLTSLAREVLGFKIPKEIHVQASVTIKLKVTANATVTPDAVKARVNQLIDERLNCRKEKKWQQADEIRKGLAELGVILEDAKTETTVSYKQVPSEESLDSLMKELGIDFQDTPTKDGE